MATDASPSSHPKVGLLVIAESPPRLRRWLPATTASAVEVVEPGSTESARCAILGSVLATEVVGRQPVVRLPIDGPIAALDGALRGLRGLLGDRAARTVVVAVTIDGPPPSPEVLQQVARARLRPGVDLTGYQWTADGPDDAPWNDILQAGYVELCVAALRAVANTVPG